MGLADHTEYHTAPIHRYCTNCQPLSSGNTSCTDIACWNWQQSLDWQIIAIWAGSILHLWQITYYSRLAVFTGRAHTAYWTGGMYLIFTTPIIMQHQSTDTNCQPLNCWKYLLYGQRLLELTVFTGLAIIGIWTGSIYILHWWQITY